MLDIYRRMEPREKVLVWVLLVAVLVMLVRIGGGIDAVGWAQIIVAGGTLALAGLAYAEVREIRESRVAQEAPQVIVDADYSKPPFVYIVVRNIGKGAAKNITFEFSAPMEAPEGRDNQYWVPVNEQGYFVEGMEYLAPGAEIRNLWGSMPTLAPFLREQELYNGITITSRYQSLAGRHYTNQWIVNPLLIANRLSTREVGMRELVDAVERLASDLDRVVSYNNELYISTASERQEKNAQRDEGS